MDELNKTQHNEKEEQERTTTKKKACIEAMRKCLGVVTQACKMVDIDRGTYYLWYNGDEEFRKQCDDCSEIALDFAESKLHKQIEDNIPTSTIFFLKTKGKHRGYIEKSEHDMTSNGQTMGVIYLPQRHELDTNADTDESITA